jgi:hypothetical protein
MPIENRRDCGGPPQTGRSRGRQQDDEPDVAAGLVEVRAQCFDGMRRKVKKRRLPEWRIVRPELLPAQRGGQRYRDRQDKPPASGERHLRQPLRDHGGKHLREQSYKNDDGRRGCQHNDRSALARRALPLGSPQLDDAENQQAG